MFDSRIFLDSNPTFILRNSKSCLRRKDLFGTVVVRTIHLCLEGLDGSEIRGTCKNGRTKDIMDGNRSRRDRSP